MARNTDSFKAGHKKTISPAYTAAGYKATGHSAEVASARLSRNVEVRNRIAELQGSKVKQITDLRDLVCQHTREALETLVSVMGDERAPAAARVAAANGILDRGHGKPTQHIEANVNVFDRLSLSEKEILLTALESLNGDEEDASGGPAPTHH